MCVRLDGGVTDVIDCSKMRIMFWRFGTVVRVHPINLGRTDYSLGVCQHPQPLRGQFTQLKYIRKILSTLVHQW